jgi:hypothetical protein
MKQPSWYAPMEKKLLPIQWFVDIGLILIAVISITLIIKRNSVAKTFWFVYLISP